MTVYWNTTLIAYLIPFGPHRITDVNCNCGFSNSYCFNDAFAAFTRKSHGIKGFVIPTKSFVKIGITKISCYNNKMFSSINKTFGCCSEIFGCSNKRIICCPIFCCRNKTIFFRAVHHKPHRLKLGWAGYGASPCARCHFARRRGERSGFGLSDCV